MADRESVAELHHSCSEGATPTPWAAPVSDKASLDRVAKTFAGKYDHPFNFKARDFAAYGEGGETLLYEVRPRKAFGYGRGERYSAPLALLAAETRSAAPLQPVGPQQRRQAGKPGRTGP
jgi:hypothetical protein